MHVQALEGAPVVVAAHRVVVEVVVEAPAGQPWAGIVSIRLLR